MHKKRTTSATSEGSANLFSRGICDFVISLSFLGKGSVNGVFTIDGDTELTLIPKEPNYVAMHFVSHNKEYFPTI